MSICTSLDLYFERGPPISENQVNESQSHIASSLFSLVGGKDMIMFVASESQNSS